MNRFHTTKEDVANIEELPTFVKYWSTIKGGYFTLGNPLRLAHFMKISDFSVYNGAVGVYIIDQCEGISQQFKELFADYLYVLEYICYKRLSTTLKP